jgi:hypothetical protein
MVPETHLSLSLFLSLCVSLLFVYSIDSTTGLQFVDYPISSLSSATFSLFAPIEPILIVPAMWSILQLIPDVLPPAIARVSIPSHGRLSQLVCSFLANQKHGTRSENGLISRDDSLLDIICLLTGLEAERNTVSVSTQHMTRSDVWLAWPGTPPLVHVEEKAGAGELEVARSELTKKFCSLPHYLPALTFIVGIAIAGDLICFGKLPLSGAGFEPLAPTFNIVHLDQRIRLDTTSIGTLKSISCNVCSSLTCCFLSLCVCVFVSLSCVQAAVNVGRWARHALDAQLLSPIAFPIGQKQVDDRRELTLMSSGIKKKYLRISRQQRDWLQHLYTQLSVSKQGAKSQIRCMEWATSCAVNDDELKVHLQPFGVHPRPPRTLSELRAALRCVLTCLTDLHAAGWSHLDLRWSNLIYLTPSEWVVIDAEFARPFKSEIPVELKKKDPEAKGADEQADCYLVGLMMMEYIKFFEQDKRAHELAAYLMAPGARERSKRSARGALESHFFRTA